MLHPKNPLGALLPIACLIHNLLIKLDFMLIIVLFFTRTPGEEKICMLSLYQIIIYNKRHLQRSLLFWYFSVLFSFLCFMYVTKL